MSKHWANMKYLARHKWFVLIAGRKLGVSLWCLLIHDWTKLTPAEWGGYADYFFGEKAEHWTPEFTKRRRERFDRAWLHHIHWNKHHWQYWCHDNEPMMPGQIDMLVSMPEKYAREMVADWMGAGRAITGKWDAKNWYEARKDGIALHPETRKLVESLLA